MKKLRMGTDKQLYVVSGRSHPELSLEIADCLDIEGAVNAQGKTDELQVEPWAFRKAYQEAMNNFVEEVATRCRKAAIDHMLLTTEKDLGFELCDYLHSRLTTAGIKRGGKIGAQSPVAPAGEGA